jgi:hypothetical protein
VQTRKPDKPVGNGQPWGQDAAEREYLTMVQFLLQEWTTSEDAAAYDNLSGETSSSGELSSRRT